MLSRRQFLGLSALGTAGAAAAGLGIKDTTGEFEVIERTVQIPHLPANFTGYRIGVLGDAHLGETFPHEWIERPLRALREAKIDLLCLVGDYVWIPETLGSLSFLGRRNQRFASFTGPALTQKVFDDFCDLTSAIAPPDGKVAIFGNHDHWSGPQECQIAFKRAGIPLLVNAAHRIQRGNQTLYLYGLDDYWTGIPELPALSPREIGKEVRILLSHNPDMISSFSDLPGFDFDLALAGHTHGGQIRLPIVGALHYNIRDHRLAEGLIALPRLQAYVTRGIGVVEFPYRLNCPGDVSVLTLQKA